VGGEAGGSQRHEEIDLENSDGRESQPWERPFVPKSGRVCSSPSSVPSKVHSVFLPRDHAHRRRRPSLSPHSISFPLSLAVSLAVGHSCIECRHLLPSAWSLPMRHTQFLTGFLSSGFPLSCGTQLLGKFFSNATSLTCIFQISPSRVLLPSLGPVPSFMKIRLE